LSGLRTESHANSSSSGSTSREKSLSASTALGVETASSTFYLFYPSSFSLSSFVCLFPCFFPVCSLS
jgi:hypothetical protein